MTEKLVSRRSGDPAIRAGTDADGTLVSGPIGRYRTNAYGVKRCETCGQLWAADLDFCPYCNISQSARVLYAQKQRA